MNDIVEVEFELRGFNEDERTVSGYAMPYDEDSVGVAGYKERFVRGAFAEAESGTLVYFNHDYAIDINAAPIGTIKELREDDEGLWITASISKHTKADAIYTMVKEGKIQSFSVGFNPVESRVDADGTVVRTKALLKEVSILPKGAYKNAAVALVRSADTQNTKEKEMENTNNAPEVAEIREAVSGIERELKVLKAGATNVAEPQVLFRSGGDFLKALKAGDEKVKTELRAYTGATTAETVVKDSWQGRALTVVEENRDLVNFFNRSPQSKPVKRVEFPVRTPTYTGTVGLHNEGEDLNYVEVVVTEAYADLRLYGAYSSLSRESIELSSVAYLDAVLMTQAQEYARKTNDVLRTALVGATGTGTDTLAGTADTAAEWIRLVLRARRFIKTNGNSQAAAVVVSGDVFDRLATMVDTTGRPLFDLNSDGVNTVGSVALAGQTGALAGLPVLLDDVAPAGTCIFAGKDAVTSFEVTGAPVRLQDENIINLTTDFSLSGWFGVGVTNASAIVKADVTF